MKSLQGYAQLMKDREVRAARQDLFERVAEPFRTVFYVFLILKLAALVDWSWWFVFLPLILMPIVCIVAWRATCWFVRWKLRAEGLLE